MVSARQWAEDPLDRLEVLLAEELAQLETVRGRLGEAGDALLQLRTRWHHVDIDGRPAAQVIPQDVAGPVIDRLAARVDRVDSVVLSGLVGAGVDETNVRHERERAAAGQRQRTLLHPSVLQDTAARAAYAAKRESGQRQRLSESFGTELLLLGREAAVTLETWGDAGSPYLVVQSPALIECFAAWFDAVWASSPEIGAPGSREEDLIRLLSLGIKDEGIARSLGLSLRTVRRRVSSLMDHYGIDTRFQLGAALERDGRL